LGLIYWLLGIAVDQVVPHISHTREQSLAPLFSDMYKSQVDGAEQNQLQTLATALNQGVEPEQRPTPHVHYLPDETVNALALPGGDIIVYEGLLAQAKSENEIAFVLGHELGHVVHRHALKRLGRSLLITLGSQIVFAQQSSVHQWVNSTFSGAEMTYSRAQEAEADQVGLRLLVKHYGHAGGATDFFERLAQKKELPLFSDYLSTHPAPEKRVHWLQQQIKQDQLKLGDLKPWAVEPSKAQ